MVKLTLYQKIAETMAQKIKSHLYQPGDKLPSLRSLSRENRVSAATAQEAYYLLESWGLIEARPQSGFYVKPLPLNSSASDEVNFEVAGPALVSVSQAATQLFQLNQQQGLLNLGTAYPHSAFLPLKQLKRITGDIVKNRIDSVSRVDFAPGNAELRRQLALHLSSNDNMLSADDLVITSGCQEALSLSLRAIANPGDCIAIESPIFVGILQAIEALGLKAIEIPSHPESGISISALELAIDQWQIKGCVLVPSYSNPSGSCMPLERRQQLLALTEAEGIPIIEDGLFDELSHSGKAPPSLKSLAAKPENVLYCSSVSKSLAPGVRVGWIAAGQFQAKIEYLKSFISVGCSSLDCLLVSEFFHSGNYVRHIRSMQQAFSNQVNLFSAAIASHFPEGTSISRPRGGYILWVGLPRGVDAWRVYQEGLKKHIALVPGQLFSTTSKYNNYIRINCALPWGDNLRLALAQLGEIVQRAADEAR